MSASESVSLLAALPITCLDFRRLADLVSFLVMEAEEPLLAITLEELVSGLLGAVFSASESVTRTEDASFVGVFYNTKQFISNGILNLP